MSDEGSSPTTSLTNDPYSTSQIRPGMSRSSSVSSFLSRSGVDRYGEEWGTSALTLIDVAETFFDSRLDLFNRRLKEQSSRLKSRAVELIPKGLRTPKVGPLSMEDDEGEDEDGVRQRRADGRGRYKLDAEREVDRIKVKLAAKVTHLSTTWRSVQIVRTREKVSFLFGVMSLTFSCILYGAAPEWLPFAYTAQSAFYLPSRAWIYKRKQFHYFLFDMCYFVNILDLLWIWVFPGSTVLFIGCYLLTLGPLASAIITWRNSLVFHSLDKVTSLFIHMYPPVVLTVIRHTVPNPEVRYPGLAGLSDYNWYTMILLAAVPYIIWQAAYYKFISLDRKQKIESGQRQTSFHYMLNDKRGPIGKLLRGIKPDHRELWFIFCQLIYSVIFMVPAATLFIHSARATNVFLVVIFAVSAWNGATFYVEVFGRKFEKELEKLRKEMELASATGSLTTPSGANSPYPDHDPLSPNGGSSHGDMDVNGSPLVLPGTNQNGADLSVPELVLEGAGGEGSGKAKSA